MINRLIPSRNEAEDLYQSLVDNKVLPQNIPASIRQIDAKYDFIFNFLADWCYGESKEKRDDFYLKAKRSFYSFLDPAYDKPLSDMSVWGVVENSFPGGISHKFKFYLRDRIQYMLRVTEFLKQLKVQLSGHGTALTFQQAHVRNDSKLICDIRQVVDIKFPVSETTLLNAFAAVRQLIVTAKLDDESEQIKRFLTDQKQVLEGFGFQGQVVYRVAAGKSLK